VPVTSDEVTFMGMNLPDLQETITKIGILGVGLLIAVVVVRIIKDLRKM
jgi:hypothetical protein